MADKKVSELSAITNLSGDDLLLVVNDPSGTPTSNKVTVSNLFANVVPNVVHKGTVTTRANTTFTGTTMTVSANLVLGGTNVLLSVNDRMQVSNTNTIVNDRMQVSNTNTIVNDRMQVANVQSLIANETANSDSKFATWGSLTSTNTAIRSYVDVSVANLFDSVTEQFANSENSILTGNTTADDISTNTFVVTSNTGLRIASKSNDPATSNAANEGITAGSIFYSNTHLYVATDDNTIQRVALSTF